MLLLTIDGVLRNRKHIPIPDGLKVYTMLTDWYRIWLTGDGTAEEIEFWMKRQNLSGYAGIIGNDVPRRSDSLREDQFAYAKTISVVEMVIDPDPAFAAHVLSQGIQTVLWTHPSYTRPEFRPDADKPRSWDLIQQELDRQDGLIAVDKRLDEDQDKRFGD